MKPIQGLHHITAVAGDAQANVDFYEGVLGQRLVKTTVNFDDPGTHHLYYADEVGTPGTVLTFTGSGREQASSIVDVETGAALRIRSESRGVTTDYAYTLEDDPGGTRVSLVATCAVSGVQRLFGPVLRDALRRTDSNQLEALRALVEGG